MGGRVFGDLGGKEIEEGGSEGRRGEGDFEVGNVLDGRGNGKGNGLEHGGVKLRGTKHSGEIRD